MEQVAQKLKLKQEDGEHQQEQEHRFKQQDCEYEQKQGHGFKQQDGRDKHLRHFVQSEAGFIQGRALLHGEEGRYTVSHRGAQWHERGQDQGGQWTQFRLPEHRQGVEVAVSRRTVMSASD
jgi:hypothetical protein